MATKKPPQIVPPKTTRPATPAAPHDPAFLAEIDAAVQQEKLLNLWHHYRLYIVTAIVLILAAIIAWQGYAAYTRHQAASLAEAIYQANRTNDTTKLATLLPQSKLGNKAVIAFTQARAAATPLDADRAYALVYTDRTQPDWLRGLARLQAAMVLMAKEPTLAQEHLTQLVQEQSHPSILPAALELLAVMAQSQGDVTTARSYTQRQLSIPQLTPDMRQRAQRRLAALSTFAP